MIIQSVQKSVQLAKHYGISTDDAAIWHLQLCIAMGQEFVPGLRIEWPKTVREGYMEEQSKKWNILTHAQLIADVEVIRKKHPSKPETFLLESLIRRADAGQGRELYRGLTVRSLNARLVEARQKQLGPALMWAKGISPDGGFEAFARFASANSVLPSLDDRKQPQ